MDEVPFKDVYIHALVRDSKGQKMSKSKGNVMDPLDLIEEYGADALRFTMTAMAAQGRDIRLSTQRIEGYRNFTTKIWNAARYAQMNGCTPSEGFDPASVKHPVNQWIIAELIQTKAALEKAIETYRFNEGANALYQFVWNSYCDWYVEFTKPLLQGESEAKGEIQRTMAWVMDQILTLLNPVMPFITEELYARIAPRNSSLLEAQWPRYPEAAAFKDAHGQIAWLQALISEVRSVRADMNVPAGAIIPLLVKDTNAQAQSLIEGNAEIISRLARVKDIAFVDEAPRGAIQAVIDQATLLLPVADTIDLDKERARLRKELEKLDKDIKTTDAKLGNDKFVSNAPAEVIAEQKERKATAEQARAKIAAALSQLELAG
jgi:valyl-tRNA synthetase